MATLTGVQSNGHSEVKSPFLKRETSDDRPGDDNVKKKRQRLSESVLFSRVPGQQCVGSSGESWNVAPPSFSSLPGGPSRNKHAASLKTKLKKIKKEGKYILLSSSTRI